LTLTSHAQGGNPSRPRPLRPHQRLIKGRASHAGARVGMGLPTYVEYGRRERKENEEKGTDLYSLSKVTAEHPDWAACSFGRQESPETSALLSG
jgi:hypothetical protein